jgi:hypothetical protein
LIIRIYTSCLLIVLSEKNQPFNNLIYGWNAGFFSF